VLNHEEIRFFIQLVVERIKDLEERFHNFFHLFLWCKQEEAIDHRKVGAVNDILKYRNNDEDSARPGPQTAAGELTSSTAPAAAILITDYLTHGG